MEIASGRSSGEKELLEALRQEGEITAVRATMKTSLSVSEAGQMPKELAEAGHLEVRMRGGSLFYTFWEEAGRFATEARPSVIQ